MSVAACRCSTIYPAICRRRSISASRCSPARPRDASTRSCGTRSPSRLQPVYNFLADLPGLQGTPRPYLPPDVAAALLATDRVVRRRPRLPVPVQLLHDHQRPGAQVALPHRRTTSSGSLRAHLAQGVDRFFITDDNFARNQQLGSDPRSRSSRCASREGIRFKFLIQVDALRHQHPELHRESVAAPDATAGLHRAGERSIPAICCRPRSARTRSASTARCCRRGGGRRHHLLPATFLAFPSDTPRVDRARHRDSSSASCRSISWSSSCSRRCPDRQTTRNSPVRVSRWSAT